MPDTLLHSIANRIREIIRVHQPRSADDQCRETIYAQAEHDASGHELTDDQPARFFQGRWFGRFFGLVWLAFLVSAYPELWREPLPLARAIAAWAALITFTLSFVTIILVGTPLWATDKSRDQRLNRLLVGGQLGALLALIVLLPSWEFGYVFIYCAVSAGIFLTRRDAMRIIALSTALSLIASLSENVAIGDMLTGALLVGGIGMNSAFWSALMAQNRALRRARAEITRLAVTEERLRIARDLHDLLGHNLSIITLKSELAGRLLASHPERAASEIADVQQVARTALQEVREAVAGYRAVPLASEIDHGRQMLQAAGVLLSTRIAVDELPMEIDRALAWFVREGTTNIIRHAGASSATLRIDQIGQQVFAEYTDNGRTLPSATGSPSPSPSRAPGARFGLIGLGERMRALGGELSAGPMPEHGYRLAVTIALPRADQPEDLPIDAPTSEIAS